ncbi:MAG: hypothetical protein PWP24_1139 [Clostridiales bacterium]|nr:hypothetical protein [Clostridiales bacterium]
MPKSEKRCQEIREEMRGKILRESALYFARNGFAKTKISDLAKQLGIGQGTIYVYFKSKEELYEEIKQMANNEKEQAKIKALALLPISAKKKIEILVDQILKSFEKDDIYAAKITLHTQLMLEESQYDAGQSLYQSDLYLDTAKILKQGQKEGTVIEGDVMELVDFFWSVIYVYALKSQFSKHYKMLKAMELKRIWLTDACLQGEEP